MSFSLLGGLVTVVAIVSSTLLAAQSTWTFEEDQEGKLPSGWSAAKTGEGAGGVWKVVAYDARGKVGRALAQTSPDGPNALFNLCVVDGAKYADVDLSVRVK